MDPNSAGNIGALSQGGGATASYTGATFEPPSPTQQGSSAFAWGLAQAGAAPPNSPFLFKQSQAESLDQPVLPLPPMHVATDADMHVGSPPAAETPSLHPHASLSSLSNTSFPVAGPSSGPHSGGAAGGAHFPAQSFAAADFQQQVAMQLAEQQQQQQQQQQLQQAAGLPPQQLPTAAAAAQQQLQQQAAQQGLLPLQPQVPQQQPQLQTVIDPRSGLPVVVSAAPQPVAAPVLQPPVPNIPVPGSEHLQLPPDMSAAKQQLTASQPLGGSPPGTSLPPTSAMLAGYMSGLPQAGVSGLPQPAAANAALPQTSLQQHLATVNPALAAAISQQQQSAQLQTQQLQQQSAQLQNQQLQQQLAQQQTQHHAAVAGLQQQLAAADLQQQASEATISQLSHLNAHQLERVTMLSQAAAAAQPTLQPGIGSESVASLGSAAGSVAGSIAGAGSLPVGSIAAPGALPTGNIPGSIAGASVFPGFPPQAPLSHPMHMAGFTSMSMGLPVSAPIPVLPSGAVGSAATPELNALVAHFEGALLAASGTTVPTPALLAQAQQAARQHLASQQLAMRLAAAQNPLAAGIGAVNPTAAALAAASGVGAVPPVLPPNPLAVVAPSIASDISNLGSLPVASEQAVPLVRPRLPAKVKVVLNVGGQFVRNLSATDGSVSHNYQGGETRLISIPANAVMRDILDSLDRVAGSSITSASSAGMSSAHTLKYQLPTDPSLYVDIVDDEDVVMMLEEWREASAAIPPGSPALRLHVFVQYRGATVARASDESDASLLRHSAESERQQHHSAGSIGGASTSSLNASTAASPRTTQGFEALAERMEIIKPEDIQLVKFLGAGGYGEVYLGKWHGCDAAVKCLNPGLFFGGDSGVNNVAVAELVKEADILGRLRHPNVVWVIGMVLPPLQDGSDSGEGGDGTRETTPEAPPQPTGPGTVRPPAIVTEYLAGGSLQGALSRKLEMVHGSFTRLLIALDAAKGMEYLHSKGIVHFDMKSANLLLGHRDRRVVCKVADFGLSKQKQQTYVSGVSSSRGTLPWIAPEIIKSPDAVTEKVDVYSYGIVLWELWTGREPFEGLNYHALLHQMTSAGEAVRPPLPGSADWDAAGNFGAEPAPGYRDLLERCWCDRPSQRPGFGTIVKELTAMAAAIRPRRRSAASSSANRGSAAGPAAAPSAAAAEGQPPPSVPASAATSYASTSTQAATGRGSDQSSVPATPPVTPVASGAGVRQGTQANIPPQAADAAQPSASAAPISETVAAEQPGVAAPAQQQAAAVDEAPAAVATPQEAVIGAPVLVASTAQPDPPAAQAAASDVANPTSQLASQPEG